MMSKTVQMPLNALKRLRSWYASGHAEFMILSFLFVSSVSLDNVLEFEFGLSAGFDWFRKSQRASNFA